MKFGDSVVKATWPRQSVVPRPKILTPSWIRFKLSWYCWGRSAPKPPDTVKGLLPLYDSPLRPQGPRVQFCFVYTPLARQRLAALRVHKTKLCLRLSGKAGFELERLTKGGKSILHLKKRTQNPREAQKSVISRQLKTKPCDRYVHG